MKLFFCIASKENVDQLEIQLICPSWLQWNITITTTQATDQNQSQYQDGRIAETFYYKEAYCVYFCWDLQNMAVTVRWSSKQGGR